MDFIAFCAHCRLEYVMKAQPETARGQGKRVVTGYIIHWNVLILTYSFILLFTELIHTIFRYMIIYFRYC